MTEADVRDRPAPPGLWVAFLGADGCGKSTVIEHVERRLGPAWNGARRFHLRPHFGLRDPEGPPVTDPHGQVPRGRVTNVLKLGLWWLDCTLGYLLAVRPLLSRGRLVLFDRFVHDLLVDPRRYRFHGSEGLARAILGSIPAPDLFVVLDAPPEVLRARKQEVSDAEVVRQRAAYRDLAASMENAAVIDASRPVEAVVEDVESRIRAVLPA